MRGREENEAATCGRARCQHLVAHALKLRGFGFAVGGKGVAHGESVKMIHCVNTVCEGVGVAAHIWARMSLGPTNIASTLGRA